MNKKVILLIFTIVLLKLQFIYAQVNTAQTNNSFSKIISSNELVMTQADFVQTADGNFLIIGACFIKDSLYTPSPQLIFNGQLTKINKLGNMIWNKNYISDNTGISKDLFYQKVLELKDGSILLVGQITNDFTNNRDLILTKTTNTGTVLWSKTYKGKFTEPTINGITSDLGIQFIKEDPNSNDIYLAGTTGPVQQAFLIRFQSNGTIKWSNIYHAQNEYSRIIGMDILNNEIRFFSILNITFFDPQTTFTYDIGANRIKKNDGRMISQKFLKPTLASTKASFNDLNLKVVKATNGNYLISGSNNYNEGLLNYETKDTFYQGAVLELNDNFDFVRSFSINSPIPTNGAYMSVDKNRNGILSIFNFPNYDTNYIVQFKDTVILKARKIISNYTNAAGGATTASINTQNSDFVLDTYSIANDSSIALRLLKLSSSDTVSCLGINDNAFYITPLEYLPSPIISDQIIKDVFSLVSNRNITSINRSLNTTQFCEQIFQPAFGGGGCEEDEDDDEHKRNVSTSRNSLSVMVEKLENKHIEVLYPNPFINLINVQVEIKQSDVCRINIVSANGIVEKTFLYSLRKGKNNISIDGLEVLKPGTYFVKITTSSEELVTKIIKL